MNPPGLEPPRFAAADGAVDALSGRADFAGTGLDARGPAGFDGGALLGMDVWAGSPRSLDARAPASLSVAPGADLRESIERAVDHILAPLG